MQISSISTIPEQNPGGWQLDRPVQPAVDTGQNMPAQASSAQYFSYDQGTVSTPRASLTASATAVASQSVDNVATRIDTVVAVAAYQSSQNDKGLYGYQAMLGAPLIG